MADATLMGVVNWHSTFFMLFATVACVFGAAVLFSSNVVRMAFYLVISLAATAGLFFLAGSEFLGAMQIMIYVGGTLVLLIFGVMLTAQESFINLKTRGGEWVLGMIVGATFLSLLAATAFNVAAWRTPHEELANYNQSIKRAEAYDRGDRFPPERPLSLDEEIAPYRKQSEEAAAEQAEAMRENDTLGVKKALDRRLEAEKVIAQKMEEWEEERVKAWENIPDPKFPKQQRLTGQIGAAFVGVRVDNNHFADNPTLQRGQSGYLLAFQAVGIHLLVVLVGAAYLSRTRKFTGARTRVPASFAERTDRKRGIIVPVLLVLGILVHLSNILGFVSLSQGNDFGDPTLAAFTGLPEWFYTAMIAINTAQIVLLMAVWSWQRWAVYVLGVLPLVNAAIIYYVGIPSALSPGYEAPFVAGALIAGYIPFALLIGALCFIGRPSYWSQMD